MTVSLHYSEELETYGFGAGHPMRPERFSFAVRLMDEWGHISPQGVHIAQRECARAMRVPPEAADDDDLLLAHTREYVEYVKGASRNPHIAPEHGIGPGDTPAFEGMHPAAARAVGASMAAVDAVREGRSRRAFSPAGGLHHAMRDRAAGFCVYNDAVVAIERALATEPRLRIAYVDIDAHHGDGVEAAFEQRPEVLTLSIHESGRYLFPGTGSADDIGRGPGLGSALNVPLPPLAGPDCFELAYIEIVQPALRAFGPDLLVVQGGADSHRGDPLTHLMQTVAGYSNLIASICELADELTEGRLVLLGGGGYQPFDAVPRMWASAMAVLLGREIPSTLPSAWVDEARAAAPSPAQGPGSADTMFEADEGPDEEQAAAALASTRASIEAVRRASPLLGGAR